MKNIHQCSSYYLVIKMGSACVQLQHTVCAAGVKVCLNEYFDHSIALFGVYSHIKITSYTHLCHLKPEQPQVNQNIWIV